MVFDPPFSLSSFFPLITIWLYAEIHYRFKFIPSRLFYRQPEIIADAPHRLDCKQALPILVIIKDAHRFPIELQSINARINLETAKGKSFCLFNSREPIRAPFWWRTFQIAIPDEWRGHLAHLDIEMVYRCGKRQFRCANDNYHGASHAPLRVYFANEPLPALPNFWHGELHCHTEATSDQVEFGAPLEAMIELAQAQGLNFFAATDHSYDLDDFPDNYLKNDPALRKWHALQERLKRSNEKHRDFVIIPGEEVSAGNARRRNVHFLIFNHAEFLPGSGDSAERWFRTEPELSIHEILEQIGAASLAFAAHPETPAPFLERLLLRRGQWEWSDYQHPRLNGLQIWNGALEGVSEGASRWRELLLAGKKLFIIAGNDAHGNFNRFRQVGIPHLKMREHYWHLFGRTRTAVWLEDQLNLTSLLAALKNGSACITTGPVMDLKLLTPNGRMVRLGETTNEPVKTLLLEARSSAEFGPLQKVVIWRGNLQKSTERVLFEQTQFIEPYKFSAAVPLNFAEGEYYVRGEVLSAGSHFLPEPLLPCQALTNPIWVKPTLTS